MFHQEQYEQYKESLDQAYQFFNFVSIYDGRAKIDSAILNLSSAMKDFDSYINQYKKSSNEENDLKLKWLKQHRI